MTRVDVKIDARIDFAKADRLTQGMVERGVRAASQEGETLTKGLLSQPGQGKIYDRGTYSHRASAPGDAPAPDTGRLRNSTSHDVVATATGAIGTVSVNTEYAAGLELGTEKIQPRPYLSKLPRLYGERLKRVFAAFAKV